MINAVWLILLIGGIISAAVTGNMDATGQAVLQGAQDGMALCLTLAGGYALWMGVMRVAQKAGLVRLLARLLRGVMSYLFAGAQPPAREAIMMNLSANMLGMGNAATPFGLEAMRLLSAQGNAIPGTASDAMCMLLIINTASVQLIPTTVISLRVAASSSDPSAIILPTLLATALSMIAAIALGRMAARRYARRGK